jgi:hypothetical protein
VSEGGSVNCAGEVDPFLKAAVSDFHLLITVPFPIDTVSATTANYHIRIAKKYLQVIIADSGKIDFYNPTLASAVNISGRIPEASGRSDMIAYPYQRERSFWEWHGYSISENEMSSKGKRKEESFSIYHLTFLICLFWCDFVDRLLSPELRTIH